MVSPLRRRLGALSLCLLLAGTFAVGSARPAAAAEELVGTFRIAPGACAGGAATGSYFRMILPTGGLDGPWVENADSTCADRTYTLLSPGTDGGLVTGSHQPAPSPGFDDAGNSTATRIIRPVRFFGVAFSASTDPRDLQTGTGVPAPTVQADGGRLSGDLRAFAATWNEQAFNQGAPKPDGSRPGNTALPQGSYDPATGAFSLTWTSTIVGGPFDKFTGLWHLEGTFVPAGAAAPSEGSGAAVTPVAPGAEAGTPAPGAPVPGDAAPADGQEPGAPDDGAGAATDLGGSAASDPELALGARVDDQSFEAPTWLVVLLALLGIVGVVVLLVLGPRSRGGSGPDRPDGGAPASEAAAPSPASRRRRRALQGVVAIGVGLAVAPLAFQMFSRAPGGGEMIDDFAPYMREAKIDSFRTDLDTIDAAHVETAALLAADPTIAERQPAVATFAREWPAIDDDMGSMLATMRSNIDHYDGIAALPPFALFPWFFVAPGVLLAGLGLWSLRADRGRDQPARSRTVALAVVAVGLLAAPVAFQMFTRAPGGARMIDDFRPFMTSEKVTEIQGYFLTIGTAEGDLRRAVLPEAAESGSTAPTGAIATLNQEWARISGEMAPMIGTMSDNVGRFAGVAALPPFWLFPWFFVLPGLLVLGLLRFAHHPPTPTGEDPAMATTTPARPRLLGFPDPVNEVSARLVATGVVLMAVTTIAFDLRWATLVLAYGFLARVLTGPKLSPLGQLVTRVITPRLDLEPRLVPGPPKRFAQGVGVAFTVTAAVLTFGFDQWGAAQVVLAILVVAASLEAFVGFCLGCKMFALLMRVGVIPEEVCERCADLWGTRRDSSAPVAT